METANDMKAHEKTYSAFIANLKWILPVIVVIAAFVVWLIS